MCRMYERSTRVRLSFSGGPHAPVNMADSMENVGSLTVSGSKEVMELPENLKALQKLDVQNIVQRSKCAISCIVFPPTFTSPILLTMFTGARGC